MTTAGGGGQHTPPDHDTQAATFEVARSPQAAGRLPYLLSVPVAGEGPLFLACKEPWPAAGDVFCLPVKGWPDGAEVIDRAPVSRCWRRGRAVHMVLNRRRRRRSMFVWVDSRDRQLVFWRTPQTMRSSRPGLRVPRARGLDAPLTVAVDVREQLPWRFSQEKATLERRELPVGDYGVFVGHELAAVVERKTTADLCRGAVAGTLAFALAELSRVPHAVLVVEGRFSDTFKTGAPVRPGWLMSLVAALQVAHPRVSWMFADNRALAERFAYRWLAAARKAEADRLAIRETAGPPPTRGDGNPREPAQLPLVVYDKRGRLAEAIRLAEAGLVWTSAQYSQHFQVSRGTARLDLKALVEAGSMDAKGAGPSRCYVRSGNGGSS